MRKGIELFLVCAALGWAVFGMVRLIPNAPSATITLGVPYRPWPGDEKNESRQTYVECPHMEDCVALLRRTCLKGFYVNSVMREQRPTLVIAECTTGP